MYGETGLCKEALQLLLEIIRQDSERNPFREEVRHRNEMIILLLIALGPRAGEILQIKTTDFSFQMNEVLIGQRRDDPQDPRINEPVPKTLDRRLPVDDKLIRSVYDYITHERRTFKAAKSHTFLLVTHQRGLFQGKALSQRGLNKIFETIRRAQPKLLGNLHPHVLRHTSNDLFSETADEQQMSEAREEQLRSYKYGWKYGSGTAAIYNKRRIAREAREASLKLQKRLLSENADQQPESAELEENDDEHK
jgi:integrase